MPEDAPVTAVISAALRRLEPPPTILHGPVAHAGANLYVVFVAESAVAVTSESGLVYRREGTELRQRSVRESPEPPPPTLLPASLRPLQQALSAALLNATEARLAQRRRFRGLLELLALPLTLVQADPARQPPTEAGRALLRLIMASLVDTFEQYLTDVIVEIHLARPATLKSEAQISAEEIVDCNDMTDVYRALANKRVRGLTRGAAAEYEKHFSKLFGLELFEESMKVRAHDFFALRNLYTHANGVVDDKYIRQTRSLLKPGDEHAMSADETRAVFDFFEAAVDRLDSAAIAKFSLAVGETPPPPTQAPPAGT